jgi:hypothetical protein
MKINPFSSTRNWKPPLGPVISPGHPLANGLVGCWLMNEGGGPSVHEMTGRGYGGGGTPPSDGVLAGNVSWIQGRDGPALNFPATGTTGVTTGQWANPAGVLSIVALVRSAIADSNYREVFRQDNAAFLLQNAGNFWAFAPTGASADYDSTATPLVVGEWALLVGTWDGAAARLYKNGTLYQNNVRGGTSIPGAFAYIGCFGVGGQMFNGQISHCMVYNRALTASEVQWITIEPYAMFLPAQAPRLYGFAAPVSSSPRPLIFVVT